MTPNSDTRGLPRQTGLMVELPGQCSLACAYCYAGRKGDKETGWAAFADRLNDLVGQLAGQENTGDGPLQLGVLGGIEPLSNFEALARTVEIVDEGMGNRECHRYIATSGYGTATQVNWLASRFDAVSVSLDGPQQVHNSQRRTGAGDPTHDSAQRAALIVKSWGGKLLIRSTITSMNVELLSGMVASFADTYEPVEIRFEPVYRLGVGNPLRPREGTFVKNFLKALEVSEKLGVRLVYPGFSVENGGRPFCNSLRGVVFLDGRGETGSCMFGEDVAPEGATSVLPEPSICLECPARNRCSRGCPDLCLWALKDPEKILFESWRCRVIRALAEALQLGRGSS